MNKSSDEKNKRDCKGTVCSPPSYNPEYEQSPHNSVKSHDKLHGDDNKNEKTDTSTHVELVNIKGTQLCGAAAAGGLAGFMLGGPVLGVVAGAGVAMAATTPGAVGGVARSSGNMVCTVGERAKKIDKEYQVVNKSKAMASQTGERAKKIDEKHRVVDNTKLFARNASIKAKDFDKKHHVVDKSKVAASSICRSAKEFDQKHRVVDKISKSLFLAANFFSSKMKSKEDKKVEKL